MLVDGEGRLDVSGFGEDYDEGFFASGGPTRLMRWFAQNGGRCPRLGADERMGSPIRRPSKIVCIGRNYRAHAAETGAEAPSEPLVFMKATSALCGPYDDVFLPRGAEKLDYEVELAVVIGRRARYVARDDALDYVAGYTLMNDYSERAFQRERGGQWTKGKSADHFAPLGPLLATAEEITPNAVTLWLSVNGEERQRASTADMIFGVAELLSYVSEFMTLLPGDVLSTGTPEGVAMGRTPPVYLRQGDVVEYGAEPLGQARQLIVGHGD